MSKLEPLFALDGTGAVTEIRGVGVQQEGQVIAVLADGQQDAPPRTTSWALSAAYEFALQLQGEGAKQSLDAAAQAADAK